VVRRIAIGRSRVRRLGRLRVLEVVLVNRGNVTERLGHGVVHATLTHGTRRAKLWAAARELRPRTVGVVLIPVRAGIAGWVSERVEVAAEPGRAAAVRTSRIRL
jgi:hypothetical protein